MKVFQPLKCTITLTSCLLANAFNVNLKSPFLSKKALSHYLQMADLVADEEQQQQTVSQLRSLKFIQLTNKTEPALLADYLMELGASSVSITDHDLDTENEQPIFGEPDKVDSFAAIVCGDAAVGKNLWLRCDVNAHFDYSYDVLSIVDNIRSTFNLETTPRFEINNVPDLDWVKEVQSSWKPVLIGGFILRFPWHTDKDVQETLQKNAEVNGDKKEDFNSYNELLLEGGIAFGTGEHPTTQLCLEYITNIFKCDEDEKIKMFLDYGAGSGVLGMAACKLDSSLEATGVEIDPDAIRIANENAERNNVNMKSYLPTDLGDNVESAALLMKAFQRSTANYLPEHLGQPSCFDACAANILAGPLISLTSTIARMLRPGAPIGLSGILEWQTDEVIEAYSEYFDDVKLEKERKGWVLITGTRKLNID